MPWRQQCGGSCQPYCIMWKNSCSFYSNVCAGHDNWTVLIAGLLHVLAMQTVVVVVVVVAFSWLVRILGECSTIHSPPALFLFFSEVEISLCTLIPLLMPGSVHSGSAIYIKGEQGQHHSITTKNYQAIKIG